MEKKTKVAFSINGVDHPINGEVMHKYNSKGNLELSFNIGTTKLDKIQIKLEQLNYIEELKDEKPNTN